jgi:hypothetical protein
VISARRNVREPTVYIHPESYDAIGLIEKKENNSTEPIR